MIIVRGHHRRLRIVERHLTSKELLEDQKGTKQY